MHFRQQRKGLTMPSCVFLELSQATPNINRLEDIRAGLTQIGQVGKPVLQVKMDILNYRTWATLKCVVRLEIGEFQRPVLSC